jgi:hypothetical protein
MSLERVGSRWLPLGWVLRSLVIINVSFFVSLSMSVGGGRFCRVGVSFLSNVHYCVMCSVVQFRSVR